MSGRLDRWADTASAQSFDRRYSGGNLEFWVPRLVELGRIRRGQWILDAGCGTGGFAAAIAGATGANVLGCDLAERFIQHAAAEHGRSRWALADVARLPVRSQSIERAVRSAAPKRYPELDQEQLRTGLARLREEFPHGGAELRPSTVIVAVKWG